MLHKLSSLDFSVKTVQLIEYIEKSDDLVDDNGIVDGSRNGEAWRILKLINCFINWNQGSKKETEWRYHYDENNRKQVE